jgi:RND family efflux transporter MFP subunit
MIAERYVDIGSHVSAAEPLFRLVDTTEIYVRLRLPERDAGLVRNGMPVILRVDSMAGAELDGAVGRIAPAVDPATRTLRVDVLPAQGADWTGVRPGMYARAEIVLAAEEDVLTVPRQAVVKERDGTYSVWRISAEATADERLVRVGLQGQQRTQILDGLTAGDRIVLRGQERLAPGMKVVLARDSEVQTEAPAQGNP